MKLAKRFLPVAVAVAISAVAILANSASAEVRTPTILDSGMVLQRNAEVPVWGWADPGEKVTVSFRGKSASATAGENGRWSVKVPTGKAGGPHKMEIAGTNVIQLDDILVGEVWVCSGQSNMQWTVQNSNDAEKEIASSDCPTIRLFAVPTRGTQEPQYFCNASWKSCGPETVGSFSAAGYFFGRELSKELNIPIGLVQCAFGGSSCEAWVKRSVLEANDAYQPLLEKWATTVATFDMDKAMAAYKPRLAQWQQAVKKAQEEGKPLPARPRLPQNPITGQHRPANLYNGMLLSVMPFGMRGVIWYQGETNASRAYQYRDLFPLMIENWRKDWGQGDFPFYFVQLANYRAVQPEPVDSDWAELREAQTMTLSLPNTGQAVIIDIGEADNIHPKNKQEVGRRLALIALAKNYGKDVVYEGPMYDSMQRKGKSIVVKFDCVGGGLKVQGGGELKGFAIAGEDRKFVWADAKIDGNTVVVSSPDVAKPVAVRYAWSDNPVCNLYNEEGLPACPFRTDDWPGMTVNNVQ